MTVIASNMPGLREAADELILQADAERHHAGERRDADRHAEHRQRRAQLRLPEVAAARDRACREASSRRVTIARTSRARPIAPSSSVTVRCAYCSARPASCVTMMIVLPSRSLRSFSSVHDLARRAAVEIAGRLVGEQQVRLVRQRARDRHALLLAAGELARAVLLPSAEADRRRAGARAWRSRSSRGTPANIIASATFSAALIVETRLNDWKMMPTLRRRWRLSSTLDICARSCSKMRSEPSVRAIEPGDQVEQRGLAGAGGAEQPEELPFADRAATRRRARAPSRPPCGSAS